MSLKYSRNKINYLHLFNQSSQICDKLLVSWVFLQVVFPIIFSLKLFHKDMSYSMLEKVSGVSLCKEWSRKRVKNNKNSFVAYLQPFCAIIAAAKRSSHIRQLCLWMKANVFQFHDSRASLRCFSKKFGRIIIF